MGTTRFEIRKEKIDKDGLVPIRLIYQVSGQRKYYNTGEKIPADNWDAKEQRAVYVKKGQLLDQDVKKINGTLIDLERKIEKIQDRFKLDGHPYSANDVIEKVNNSETPTTKRDASAKEVYAFIDRYIEDNSAARVKGSLSVYKALKRHLGGYQDKTKGKVSFDKIDHAFFQAFQNYLFTLTKKDKDGKTVKALNNVTIAKQLSTLKTFLNYAREQGIKVSDNYSTFKVKRENDLEVIALTRKEFEALYDLDLSKLPKAEDSDFSAAEQVRDVFCFSCATGLRYSDLKQLRREHIKDSVIELKAIKTGHRTIVPLNPYSKQILHKYVKEPVPLPVISNQKSNEHLTKICKLAGIDTPVEIVRRYGSHRDVKVYAKHELITMHSGRKTFATLSLEAGMSAEHVMKIGGWKDYKSFKRYINVTDEAVKSAMEHAWGIIKPNLKAV